nr:MAG TPA_asm: hypothetical protein [Caudoviricetes sp.]
MSKQFYERRKRYLEEKRRRMEEMEVSKIVLTQEQIKELARFAAEDGQPSYTITHGLIDAYEADDGKHVPEYNGLIAYSESEEHGVLQLA